MLTSRPLRFCGVSLLAALLSCSPNGERSPAAGSPADQRVQNFWTAFRHANQLRVEGSFEHAAAAYRDCLRQDPNHEESLFYLGVTLEHCGRYREAADAYRRLLDVNPQSGRALSQLASLLSTPAPGAPLDYRQAETLLRRLLEVNREQAGPFLQLGWLALNRGDAASATEDFRLAAESGSPEGFAWAGYAAHLRGRRKQAAGYFERPIELQRREGRLAGAGVRSEGDVLPAPDKPLGALDRAALISRFFLQPLPNESGGSEPFFEPVDAPPALSRGGPGAWGDFDGDGRPDLAGAGARLGLYRNLGGSFADVTEASALGGLSGAGRPLWVDYDGDARLDLYLTGERQRIFRNLGNGRFQENTEAAGLSQDHRTSQPVFFDANGDGLPDLVEAGPPSGNTPRVRLYQNVGGRFVIRSTAAWGLDGTVTGIAAADFDSDGRTDLAFVCWRKGVRLLLNRPDGSWEKVKPAEVGADALGVTVLDYDRDGRMDLLVTAHAPWEDALRSLFQPAFSQPESQPRLLRSSGGGHFEDVTAAMGLQRSYGVMQALAADFDGDQWTDLLFLNGSTDALRLEPSVLLHNESGRRFRVWSHLPAGNLVAGAAADLDGDGDQDLYLSANPLLRAASSISGLFRNTIR